MILIKNLSLDNDFIKQNVSFGPSYEPVIQWYDVLGDKIFEITDITFKYFVITFCDKLKNVK